MTAALEGGEWSAALSGRFTPGKGPVPILQEAGWVPGPVWTGAENLAPHRDSIPDRPARSQSMYDMSRQIVIMITDVPDKSCRDNRKTFYFQKHRFSENRIFYERMWENII